MIRGAAPIRRLLVVALACLPLLLDAPHLASAEEGLTQEQVRERSLPLRTALHHDPTLGSPLERLLDLYRKANRVEELVALYRSHVQRYPNDASSRVVYVRLLLATSDPEASREVRTAVEQHPDMGYLHYLLYAQLEERGDARALEALDKAISKETLAVRKRRWVDLLLTQALKEDRRDLATKHLGSLAELMGGGSEAHIKAARTMKEFGYHARAFAQLDKARAASPSPENGVEIELLASSLEVALGKRSDAAARLDTLLGRLTADYWRRSEILRRRARLVASSEERDSMLAASKKRVDDRPQDESAALDHARLLSGFERHREAMAVLKEAGQRLPASSRIETEILAAYDRLRDEHGRVAYLEERLDLQPKRQDLLERRVRSLFLLGRKSKALAQLDAMLEPLAEGVRIQRLLESARFLRTAGLQSTAAALYERVVALAPARLDVRREWAECHLADGDRMGARRVLAASIPNDTPRDVFLDLMQLLTSQLLYPEARKALRERLKAHPDDLDVYLALIDVEGSLGYGSSGAKLIDSARPHADTAARYRRWLEQAANFHVFYDTETAFLDAEQARLEAIQGDWTKTRTGRIEAFAEVSAEHDRIDPVTGMLQNYLSIELPPNVRVRLRRKLAAMLEESGRGWFNRNEAHLGLAADELRQLMADDPEFGDTYRARLALIHISRKRPDLARPLLEKLAIHRISQPRMLERLTRAYTDLDDGQHVLACLERLTVVASSDRSHWEDWMAALTASGDEQKLRSAIRRLLRGVPRLALSRDTKDDLKAHLSDSYWRSIGAEAGTQSEAGYLEALALLDQAERISADEDLPLWVVWSRAYLHNALDRSKARDEAIGELDRLMNQRRADALAQVAADHAALGPKDRKSDLEREEDRVEALARLERIHFPDGLGAAWTSARKLLTRKPTPPLKTGAVTDRRGPEGRLQVRWTFETESNAAVTTIMPLDETRLLVSDTSGDLYAVHRTNGKLIWHRPQAFAARVAAGRGANSHLIPVRVPLRGPNGLFFLPMPGRVVCYDAEGTKRWEAGLGAPQGQATPVALATGHRSIYAYETASGEVASFRLEDGKLLWHRTLAMKSQSSPAAQGEGMTIDGDQLLVYGPRTAVLSRVDGSVLWTFEPDRVRRVPVTLEEPNDELQGLFGRSRRRSQRRTASTGTAPQQSGPGAPPAPGTIFVPGFNPLSSGIRFSGRARSWAGPSSMPFAPPARPTSFVTAGQRSKQGWSPKAKPGATTAVVAPAVRWAAPLLAGEARKGMLLGGRMLLWRNLPVSGSAPTAGEVLILDMDLPMFADTARVSGTPVAVFGPRVALLQAGKLVVWHLDRSTQTSFDLKAIAGGRLRYRVHTVQDGGFLYLAGPSGLICVHLSTLKEVFRADWPASARPSRNDDPNNIQHLLSGVVEYRNQGGWSPVLPSVGMTEHGTIYTLSDPWRVVALEGATGPAPAPKDGGAK